MFFKQQTINNVVVMGRNTYDSIGKCLPNRFNLIVTHRLQLFHKEYGCSPVSSIGEALFRANSTPKRYKELFVMGGASMYAQFAKYVDRYLITLVEKEVDDGDTYLEPYIFGDLADWHINLLTEGRANPPSDEAAYEILELLPKNPQLNLRRRVEAIEEFERKLGDRRARGKGEGSDVDEKAEAGHREGLFDSDWERRAAAAGS